MFQQQPKLSPADVAIIVQAYQSGEKNVPQLAEEYTVSKATISRALNGAGIKPQRKDGLFAVRGIDETVKTQVIQDYKDGFKPNQLAEMHELKPATVETIIDEAGISEAEIVVSKPAKSKDKILPIRGVIDPEVVREMIELYAKGTVTPYDLAAMFNVNPTSVKWYLSKNGFDDVYRKPESSQGVKAGALRVKCRDLSEEVIDIWMDIARDPHEATADRIRAAERIYERAWGKPKDTVEEEEKDAPKTQGEKILKLMDSETRNKLLQNK